MTFPNVQVQKCYCFNYYGIEACDEDPCAVVARALRSKGIILKPFVIGIGIDPKIIVLEKCIGKYYDATSEATFKVRLGLFV